MTETATTSTLRPKRKKKPIVDKALALITMGYEPIQLDGGKVPTSDWKRLIGQREVLAWTGHGLGVRLLGGMLTLTITAGSDLVYDNMMEDLDRRFCFVNDAPFRNDNDNTVTLFARCTELLGKAFTYRGKFAELRCNPDPVSERNDGWVKVWDRQTEGESSGFFEGPALWEVPFDELPVLSFEETHDLCEVLRRHDSSFRPVP